MGTRHLAQSIVYIPPSPSPFPAQYYIPSAINCGQNHHKSSRSGGHSHESSASRHHHSGSLSNTRRSDSLSRGHRTRSLPKDRHPKLSNRNYGRSLSALPYSPSVQPLSPSKKLKKRGSSSGKRRSSSREHTGSSSGKRRSSSTQRRPPFRENQPSYRQHESLPGGPESGCCNMPWFCGAPHSAGFQPVLLACHALPPCNHHNQTPPHYPRHHHISTLGAQVPVSCSHIINQTAGKYKSNSKIFSLINQSPFPITPPSMSPCLSA